MSEITIKDLSRIGVPAVASANENTIISNRPQTHSELKNLKLDIHNTKTFKNYAPSIRLSKVVDSNPYTNVYEEYIFDHTSKRIYAEATANIPLFGEVSFYGEGKKTNDIIGNKSFQNFLNYSNNKTNFKGTWPDHPFIKVSFLSNQNSNILSGLSNVRGDLVPTTTADLSTVFSGKKTLSQSRNFFNWNRNYIPGTNENINLNNFYVAYPNTIDIWNYNAYNFSTVITTFNENKVLEDLEGILLISTGTQQNEKICYISNHKAETGLFNALVLVNNPKIGPNNSGINALGVSGLLVRGITIGSEYISGSNIFPTGVRNLTETDVKPQDVYSYADFASGVSGFYPKFWDRNYTLSRGDYLKQTVPIINTAYYQMYSGIYSGFRTFNTGTWNGIIPSGTQFKIELVGCELSQDKKVGTNNLLYIVYSGYGTCDQLDTKIYEALSSRNSSLNKFNNTNVKVTPENSLFSIGRGSAMSKYEAYDEAIKHLKYIVFNKFSNIIKNNIPEILYKNNKLKKLLKYLQKKNKYIGV